MRKPSIYVDTNIFSILYYRGADIRQLSRRLTTREWWEQGRPYFRVVSSAVTESELRRGTFRSQEKAIAACRRSDYLTINAAVESCGRTLVDEGLVPESKPGDALQLAIVTHYGIEYLLTWNYAHLANPEVQRKLEEVARRMKWKATTIVSPETIARRSLGRPTPRRRR